MAKCREAGSWQVQPQLRKQWVRAWQEGLSCRPAPRSGCPEAEESLCLCVVGEEGRKVGCPIGRGQTYPSLPHGRVL